MLEKILLPGFETISKPDDTVLRYLDELLLTNPNPVFYEIGIGVGATTLPVAQRLDNKGSILLFSRAKEVAELTTDLKNLGYDNIDGSWGSPSNTYSGYHFELARGFVAGALPQFDLAYIDGGHVYHLDAPAACILKELCNPGGYMIFDDWLWSLEKSPTHGPDIRPKTTEEYDPEQIRTCHVQLVCKTIMDTDTRFEFVELASSSAVYRRRQG